MKTHTPLPIAPTGQQDADAACLSCLLQYGLATIDQVIDWADKLIETATAPEIPLIELAMARDESSLDVRLRLVSLAGRQDLWHHRRAILSDPTFIANLDLETAVLIARQHDSAALDMPNDFWPMVEFNDLFFLANRGDYGSVEEVLAEFRTYLASLKP